MADIVCLLQVEQRWPLINRSLLAFNISSLHVITSKQFIGLRSWQQYQITICTSLVILSDTAILLWKCLRLLQSNHLFLRPIRL